MIEKILAPVFTAFGYVIAFFYGLAPNLGIDIILLTFAVLAILTPFAYKQMKTQMSMRGLQPKIKAIQDKHKGDRQKINEETMKMYQEQGVNPLGGCFPMLVQMPVLLPLYYLLRDPWTLVRHIPRGGDLWRSLCEGVSKCGTAGVKPNTVKAFGMDMFSTPSHAVNIKPYIVLVIVYLAIGFVQSQLTMRHQADVSPMASKLAKIMPIAFAFIIWMVPAGVGIYFIASATWRVVQNEVLVRILKGGDSKKEQ